LFDSQNSGATASLAARWGVPPAAGGLSVGAGQFQADLAETPLRGMVIRLTISARLALAIEVAATRRR
jgi:hypothetical protein